MEINMGKYTVLVKSCFTIVEQFSTVLPNKKLNNGDHNGRMMGGEIYQDTAGKRRSLPPLNTNDGDLPSPSKRKTRKKRTPTGTTDASDSQQSGKSGRSSGKLQNLDGTDGKGVNGSTENLVPDKTTQMKKTKKKRRKSAALNVENGGDDVAAEGDAEGEDASVRNLKTSPGVTRRKREHRQSRIPRSISDEVLQNLEQQAQQQAQPQPASGKKKGRRPQSKLYGEENVDGEGPHGRPPTGTGRQRKKKKMARMPTSGDENYHADGEAMSVDRMLATDDFITGVKQTDDAQQTTQQTSQVPVLPSQPVEKLFMERKGGFKSENKGRLAKRREREQKREQQPLEETKITTTQAAVSTHTTFLTLGLFCHGLLAGFALWQCVTVYMLSDPVPSSNKNGDTQFLEQYSRMAQPALSVYYFLLAICTVSVFDRFDIARPNRQFFRGLLTFQSGAVSILIYLIALIFSVSIAAIDDKISLYFKTHPDYCGDDCPNGGTLWEDEETIAQQLKIWRIINLIRAIGAVLGWLVLSFAPTTDYTSEHLHDAEEPLWDETQDIELNNVHTNP